MLVFLFFFKIQITLCFHHSVIAMKVLILILLQDAKKCGGKVINFTVQRLCKESPVKHSEWRLTALIKSQNWPAGVVFSEMKNVFFFNISYQKTQ